MTTKLDGPLKRELSVRREPYTLTITPDGLHLVPKGRRKGYELRWEDFVSGDAALATALNASLARAPAPRETAPTARASPTKRAPTKKSARRITRKR
jgi:hypothetical protein